MPAILQSVPMLCYSNGTDKKAKQSEHVRHTLCIWRLFCDRWWHGARWSQIIITEQSPRSSWMERTEDDQKMQHTYHLPSENIAHTASVSLLSLATSQAQHRCSMTVSPNNCIWWTVKRLQQSVLLADVHDTLTVTHTELFCCTLTVG